MLYVDMKLGPVIKLDKRNKIMSKKIGNNTVSENFDVITIFLIYSQFGSIWIQFGWFSDSGRIVSKTLIVTF